MIDSIHRPTGLRFRGPKATAGCIRADSDASESESLLQPDALSSERAFAAGQSQAKSDSDYLDQRIPAPYRSVSRFGDYNVSSHVEIKRHLASSKDRFLHNHGCLFDRSDSVKRHVTLTPPQLDRAMTYIGLSGAYEAEKQIYHGRIGSLEGNHVFMSHPPSSSAVVPRSWGLVIIPRTPTAARGMLSAIAVLEKTFYGAETPIGVLHKIPLGRSILGRYPARAEVKNKFIKHGWEIAEYDSDESSNPLFEAAVFPHRPDDRILFEIPRAPRVSHLQLHFYDNDGTVADLRYFKNLVAEMFGAPD